MFQVAAEQISNIAVLDDNGKVYTYGDLEKLKEVYGSCIQERSLVLVLCDYNIETASFYYCMMRLENVPMLLDAKLDGALLENILMQYEPNYIWISKKRQEQLEIGGTIIKETDGYVLLSYCNERIEVHPDLGLLLTTSGSTGSPKFVRLSKEGIIYNANIAVNMFRLSPMDRAITAVPMNFSYGLAAIHMQWLAGGSMLFTEKSMLNPSFWPLLNEYKVTNFGGVPFNYDMMLKAGFLEKDFPTLRFITEAGGKLSEKNQKIFGEALKRKGIGFYIAYGITEGTGWLTCLPLERMLEKPGSIGSVVKGMQAVLEDADENGESELCFVGKSISMGYAAKKEDLCLADENQGYLKTGDIAYMDEDGDIFLRGRKTRFIKILGKRVSLDEAQNILNIEFSLCQFAVTGKDDSMWIFFSGEGEEKEIKVFCERKFSISRQMIQVQHMETLPFSSSGKLLYEKLEMPV